MRRDVGVSLFAQQEADLAFLSLSGLDSELWLVKVRPCLSLALFSGARAAD